MEHTFAETGESPAFNVVAGEYLLSVRFTNQEESSPLAQFRLQRKDARGEWLAAQDATTNVAIAAQQAAEDAAETVKIPCRLSSGPYRFAAISTAAVKCQLVEGAESVD